MVRNAISILLRSNGFEVVEAADVPTALKLIADQSFDALLSDLHMPAQGDGLTVVSAMRHVHPEAVTMILSGYPSMNEAAKAIAAQADEILLKGMGPKELVGAINDRLREGVKPTHPTESVATILEREVQSTIEEWLSYVDRDPIVERIQLDQSRRCEHLPQLFRELIFRLRHPIPLGRPALISAAASRHGVVRFRQGYTAEMLVEESRMLQVSIFQTLQNNLYRVEFSTVLNSVMSIADEVDSQLAQTMKSFISESTSGRLNT